MKPKPLVLALLWCLMQTEIAVAAYLSLIIRNVLTLSATFFNLFHICIAYFHAANMAVTDINTREDYEKLDSDQRSDSY